MTSPGQKRSVARTPSSRNAKASPPSRSASKSNFVASPTPLAKDPEALLDHLEQIRKDDKEAFDPLDFLNKHYSTEQSLSSQLPDLRESVRKRMDALNNRISNALQRQSDTAESTRRHVQEAKSSVIELERRILQVKEKASQSEKAVLDITADMKRLDCAKKHLQRTITTLKQLHMLVHAVEQLRVTIEDTPYPNYKTASHLVEAISQLLTHFENYLNKVPHMRALSDKVILYQAELRMKLVTAFRIVAFGFQKAMELQKTPITDESEQSHPDPMSVDIMRGGIMFVDSLGEEARKVFIHDFCQDLISDYLKEFEPPQRNVEPAKRISSFKAAEKTEPENTLFGLDQIEDRFNWFLNVPLKTINNKFPNVFPGNWNLQATLSSIFLQLTRDHILALLDGPRKDADADNAAILLKALKKTILFEKETTSWLERECGAVFETTDDRTADGSAASGTKKKNVELTKPLIGVASSAFQNYMGPYIRLEEQSMDEQLTKALEDRVVDTRGERPIFISSTNLFVYIKGSITRCTALTKGNAFYLLYEAFKDSLKKYAQILNGKLPQAAPVQGPTGIAIPQFTVKQSSATSASYKIPSGEEVTICHVISTCEYCADTMEALEDLIRDTIDEEYKNKIDMISDQEQFHDITAKSIRVLVSGLENRLEGAMKTMTSINWGTMDAVGDVSAYVLPMHEEIEPFVKTVKALLPSSYFRSFCDKFAMAFTAMYYDYLVKLKRISEPGTQQLLLDLYNLKTLFLKLPVLEDTRISSKKAPGASIAPAMYTKTIQKQFGRMETMLKLVGTPNDLLVENFKMHWPDGQTADLTVVMTLKGMKRPEQVSYLEKFGYDPVQALKGATAGITSASIVSERVQQLQDQGSNVAAKVNSDLNQMRQKVDDFTRQYRKMP